MGRAELGVADAQFVLDAVRKTSNVATLDEFRVATLAAVRGLVPCDGAGYNEVDPRVGSIVYVTDPVDYVVDDFADRWARVAHEHPLLRHITETGDGSSRRMSEFLTQDEFHALALYQDLYRLIDVEYQVSFTLPAPDPLVIAIAVTSADRDFSDQDCARLDALRPHLIQAYRRAQMLEKLRGDLEAVSEVLRGPDRGFALADPTGALRVRDERSAAMFDRFVAHERGAFDAWLEDQRTRLRTGPAVPSPFEPLVLDDGDRRLVVRYVAGRLGTDVLVLHERDREDGTRPLEALGLTQREAEVLLRVTRGESNDTIASELGARPGTVRKHLEHIYRKLGVRNRTEAAAAAFEALALAD